MRFEEKLLPLMLIGGVNVFQLFCDSRTICYQSDSNILVTKLFQTDVLACVVIKCVLAVYNSISACENLYPSDVSLY